LRLRPLGVLYTALSFCQSLPESCSSGPQVFSSCPWSCPSYLSSPFQTFLFLTFPNFEWLASSLPWWRHRSQSSASLSQSWSS
jgi:hypothetical protein